MNANTLLRDTYGKLYEDSSNQKKLHSSFFTYFNSTYKRWGFRLDIQDKEEKIYIEIKDLATENIVQHDIYYLYDTLKERIKEKLYLVFYVEAETQKNNENESEEFKYTFIKVFYKCTFEKFLQLIRENKIMYDLRIGRYNSGKMLGKPHDHGSGFRVKRENLGELFNKIEIID